MPMFSTVIPTSGQDGNIFMIMGNACRLLRKLKYSDADIQKFQDRVTSADSYEKALEYVREYFPLEGDKE